MKFKTNRMLIAMGIISCLSGTFKASANVRPAIWVNQDVTTHIIMPENLKLVDISTERIVGDQCADNMLRIKPLPDSLMMQHELPEGTFMGAVTLIGERHIAQYDLLYTDNPMRSNSLFKVEYKQTDNYSNPDIPMTEAEMANYAWSICNSDRKFHTIRTKAFGLEAQIYNIYSIGNYFFLDLVLKNKTKIQYDIAQMRVTLQDKKETKATNSQVVELTPSFVLNKETSFKKDYHQVLVLPKLTFPEEKILNLEISEDQISGRVISIPIQYEDILHADAFDGDKAEAFYKIQKDYDHQNQIMNKLVKDLENKQKQLDQANSKLKEAKLRLQKRSNQYIKLEKKVAAMLDAYKGLAKLKETMPVHLAHDDLKVTEEDAYDYDLFGYDE